MSKLKIEYMSTDELKPYAEYQDKLVLYEEK